jgi:hypothetical protein
MRTRAERRHHHNRMKKKAESFLYLQWYKKNEPEIFQKQVVRTCENRKKCSCDGCGNPRRNSYAKMTDRQTLQEKINEIRFKEELDFACDSVYDDV